MTIIVKGVSIAATQVQQMQPITRRSSERETSGRLGIFMPQISCNKNIKNNNKTHDEELVKKQLKLPPHDTCVARHAPNTHWTSNAHNQLTPSRATTKQAQAATTTMKTKNYIFILIKKIEGRLCCCGSLCKFDIDS
jgi:hypothetical protein